MSYLVNRKNELLIMKSSVGANMMVVVGDRSKEEEF